MRFRAPVILAAAIALSPLGASSASASYSTSDSLLTWMWEGIFPGISTTALNLPAGGPLKLTVTFDPATPASIFFEHGYGDSPFAYYAAMTGATLSFAGRQYTSEGSGAIEVNVHCLGIAGGPQCDTQRLTEFRVHGISDRWSGPSLVANNAFVVPNIAWGGMFHDSDGALPTTHPDTGFIDVSYGQNTSYAGLFHSPATITTVGVPEPAFIRMMVPRLPAKILTLEIRSAVMPQLQRMTAWGATTLLRAVRWPARQDGTVIALSRVRLEVLEECAGFHSWVILTALLGLIAWTSRSRSLALTLGLIFMVAPLLALEKTALRVAILGLALDSGMPAYGFMHDWVGHSAFGLVLLQVIGLGRLVSSRGRVVTTTTKAAEAED
jgi:exosortase/archaeosortase family protein